MNKVKDFFKTNLYAIKWTACYVAVMFFILLVLFDFNMFSVTDWSRLFHAQLRGFPGFVFGLLILSALPLYIATTSIIIRTKKPLFELFPKKKEEKAEEKTEEKKTEEVEKPLPAGIPSELHGAYLRSRRSGNRFAAVSSFEMQDVAADSQPAPQSPHQETPALPLPDNFDFGATEETPAAPTFKPMFTDIDFGGGENDSVSQKNSALHEYLISKNYDATIDGNIIISNGMAIATHDDADFWIADEDSWFAAGKQKESPVVQALAAAEKHNVQPALYLASSNIMDLDNKLTDWESKGVRVIKKLSDI